MSHARTFVRYFREMSLISVLSFGRAHANVCALRLEMSLLSVRSFGRAHANVGALHSGDVVAFSVGSLQHNLTCQISILQTL